MKHLILTPFRCGSSYLTEFIKVNTNYDFTFLKDINKNLNKNDLIIKGHQYLVGEYENIDESIHNNFNNFDYTYTLIRKPTDIFMSAYIRDFQGRYSKYPYHFDGEISIKNIDNILEHFLSFDWNSFNWLSYEYNFEIIEKITGLDIWNLNFDKNLGIGHYSGKTNLVILNQKSLFDKNFYKNFDFFFKKHFNFSKSIREYYFFSNQKDYPEIYDVFKKKIPKSFFEKYRKLDNKIIDKFL